MTLFLTNSTEYMDGPGMDFDYHDYQIPQKFQVMANMTGCSNLNEYTYTDYMSGGKEMAVDILKCKPEISELSPDDALKAITIACRAYYNSTNSYGCVGYSDGQFRTLRNEYIDQAKQNIANMSIAFGYFTILCNVLGIIFTVSLFYLIMRNKSLQTAYGIFCLFQAAFDMIIFLYLCGYEVLLNLYHSYFDNFISNLLTYPDNPPQNTSLIMTWLFNYGNWIEWHVYCKKWNQQGECIETDRDIFREFVQIMGFIYLTAKTIAALMRLGKAANRWTMLFLPFKYNTIFQIKNTILICCMAIIGTVLVFLPTSFPFLYQCRVHSFEEPNIKTSYTYTCNHAYMYGQFYMECFIAVICLLLDISAIIKLHRLIKKNKNITNEAKSSNKKERLFLMQNCANLIAFSTSLIPYLINIKLDQDCRLATLINGPKSDIDCMYSVMRSFIDALANRSVKRAFGQCADNGITLYLQCRLLRVNVEYTSKSSHTGTQTVTRKWFCRKQTHTITPVHPLK